MLLNLIINNFALIDRLEVEFGPGFNVLTGETGAGKSIIMGAVGLLLGDRASPDMVRSGAEEATVEALFDVAAHDVLARALGEAGFAVAEELILKRIISRAGRSRAYINGSLVTLAQLQPIAELLVSICGQHEHQSLLHRDAHLSLLDQFGGLSEETLAYREAYREWQRVTGELEALQAADRDRRQRIDFLRHQSAEIAEAGLDPAEEELLLAERLLLQNAERLAGLCNAGYQLLYDDEGAVCEKLGKLAEELSSVAQIDPQLGAHAEVLRRTLYEIEDVAMQLRDRSGSALFEPGRQEEVETRLALLARLKRKYAPTIEEILAFQKACDQEIELIEHAEETQESLRGEQTRLTGVIRELGAQLSTRRSESARLMEQQVMAELADLAMPGTRFQVDLSALPEPGGAGLERVEFLIAPNRGEVLLPLGKVASGGELSRILLSLKRVSPEVEGVPTMIFDEVDAGIGGVTATSVGRKLCEVSGSTQVLCVTHLPQVAAFADRHFSVKKGDREGRTLTSLTRLEGEERVIEMARMLGGAKVTGVTLENARELIASSC